jgi:succinate dehydrogenase / fumarate reductase flavoprotein subunit
VGNLITEGVRVKGGVPGQFGRRVFMDRYAPNIKDLASRDVDVPGHGPGNPGSRGVGPKKEHILLTQEKIPAEIIHERLPGIFELAETFAAWICTREPIPVHPTAHYSMGGLPPTASASSPPVFLDQPERWSGLYAPVKRLRQRPGANRLAQLPAGHRRLRKVGGQNIREIRQKPARLRAPGRKGRRRGMAEVQPAQTLMVRTHGRHHGALQEPWTKTALVPDRGKLLKQREIMATAARFTQVELFEPRAHLQPGLNETLELATCGRGRGPVKGHWPHESRGGHNRTTIPTKRPELMKHTMAYLEEDGSIRLDTKPSASSSDRRYHSAQGKGY